MIARERLHVMVGLVADQAGRWLIAQRRAGQHMAEAWEFPGGKKTRSEGRLAGLKRELTEELGIEVLAAEPVLEIEHDYPDRRVLLDVWVVRAYSGEPESREGQPLRWVAVHDLSGAGLLDADRPIIEALERLRSL